MITKRTAEQIAWGLRTEKKDINRTQMLNNWVNVNEPINGQFAPAGYFLDAFGFVKWQGLIMSGTNNTPFTVPPSDRLPFYNIINVMASAGDALVRCNATEAGIVPVSGSTYYSLGAVYYPTFVEGFKSVTFANNWANIEADTGYAYSKAAYFKDGAGFVHLTGLIKNPNTNSSGTVAFTLPAGYRPDRQCHFGKIGSVGGAIGMPVIEVRTTGEVVINYSNSVVEWVSLDGIVFMEIDSRFQTEWQDAAGYLNGWESDTTYPFRCCYTPDGYITLDGRVKGGAVTSGTQIMWLPSKFGVAGSWQIIPCHSAAGFSAAQIRSSGRIDTRANASATWTDLTGIRFRSQIGFTI